MHGSYAADQRVVSHFSFNLDPRNCIHLTSFTIADHDGSADDTDGDILIVPPHYY